MGRRADKIIVGQRHRIRSGLIVVVLGFILGIGYPILNREFTDAFAFVNGGVIGLLGGLGLAIHKDFTLYNRMRRQPFLKRLILVSLLYTMGFAVLIVLVMGISGAIEYNETLVEHLQGPIFQEFLFQGDYNVILLYALLLSSALSFLFGMSRKVDSRVLWNIVSGKYAKPREEARIVMFLDMNRSTQIAEELGEIRYFEFVNEFFADITPSILKTEGQIYRYVGDEIVVTWPLSKHFKYENSIKTYFLAKNELKRQREKYISRYQIIPSFKAVFHCGKVIVGEIGDVKSQVVLHGQMMYVTGLIEKQCHKLGKSILVSSTLMEKVSLPKLYKVKKQGILKTHNSDIELYSISERKKFKPT